MTKLTDAGSVLLDKVSSPTSRSGYTVERVAKMSKEDVDHEVIALQMTKNSRKGNVYTIAHVDAYVQLHEDSQTSVGITTAQAAALIKDQRDQEDLELLPV